MERDDRHHREQRGSEHAVGKAPAVFADQMLRERHEDDGADTRSRERDADRGGEPLAVPARNQRRAGHHAGEAHADADHPADEEVELPEVGEPGGEKKRAAHAREPRGVYPARPQPVEDHAHERRGEAVHQEVDRIDAGELRARPAVVALERQDEHHVGVAEPAPEHVEGEAGGEHRGRGAGNRSQIFSAGSRPNTWRR